MWPAPRRAFRPGSGTTTTTATWTCSSPVMRATSATRPPTGWGALPGSRSPASTKGTARGGFREVVVERNLAVPMQPMGSNFGDLNNDGYLDFYLGTGDPSLASIVPNLMFLNQGGRRFEGRDHSGRVRSSSKRARRRLRRPGQRRRSGHLRADGRRLSGGRLQRCPLREPRRRQSLVGHSTGGPGVQRFRHRAPGSGC